MPGRSRPLPARISGEVPLSSRARLNEYLGLTGSARAHEVSDQVRATRVLAAASALSTLLRERRERGVGPPTTLGLLERFPGLVVDTSQPSQVWRLGESLVGRTVLVSDQSGGPSKPRDVTLGRVLWVAAGDSPLWAAYSRDFADGSAPPEVEKVELTADELLANRQPGNPDSSKPLPYGLYEVADHLSHHINIYDLTDAVLGLVGVETPPAPAG